MNLPTRIPTCVVYGNCQAEPIRVLLDRSPAFRSSFRTQPIPAVHTVTAGTIDSIRRAVASASLIVSHPVRDGYHGFPVGSEEILEWAAPDCLHLTIPALYDDGLYPFQVYVRGDDGPAPRAPLSIYHDLRFLYCAGKRWDFETSRYWLRGFAPSPQGIQRVASEARDGLIAYESELDVRVSARLTAPEVHARSFFTVNHPTNFALERIVAAIHAQLRIEYSAPSIDEELLGSLRTPLEPSVIAALELAASPRADWDINGETVALEDLLAAHLAWYDYHPGLVQAGLSQHEGRLWLLCMAS
jgi:Polysaccharide biosynthesis enzyme WcbI